MQERLALYQTAIESARQAGDSAKMRRYERGLKVRGREEGAGTPPLPLHSALCSSKAHICTFFQTLENLLASVRKGIAIDEEDIPPPVAVGKGPAATSSHTPAPTLPGSMNLPAPEPRVTVEGPPSTAPALSLGLAKPQLPPGRLGAGMLPWAVGGYIQWFTPLRG